jgi:hypothetical protein
LRNISQEEAETGNRKQALPRDDGRMHDASSGYERIGNRIVGTQEMNGQCQQGQYEYVQHQGVRFHGRVRIGDKTEKVSLLVCENRLFFDHSNYPHSRIFSSLWVPANNFARNLRQF